MSFHFHVPVDLYFGCGQLSHLHEMDLPGRHAFIVISNGRSTRANGYLDRVQKELELAGVDYQVFDKVSANPLKATIEEGARLFNESGSDFIVALGGGSVLDAAKAMAFLAPQPSDDLWDYAGGATGKGLPLEKPCAPWIAITTTAGTGSEVDKASVVTNPDTKEKIGIGSTGGDSIFARIAIVDPELMVSVPPAFTAYQGFDALFHAMEGYLSKKNNVYGEMVQRTAIENIARYLPRAVKDGKDIEAREGVALANTLSGYSMMVSSNIGEHAMEHALSAMHPQLAHGAGLIMISREYFTFYAENHLADDRLVSLARFLGKADAADPMDCVRALVDLQKACGVDGLKMSDYGITREELPETAQLALDTNERLLTNDRHHLTCEEILAIYEKSYR